MFPCCIVGADIDDGECGNLADAMSENQSVRTLGLQHNKIGNDELKNVVDPDFNTGGEALADMLKTNTTITSLDLSWNAIRMESAVAFGESLAHNHTLKVLMLNYNTFGDSGTQHLGRALKTNKGLTTLDLTCNSMTPKSTTVLANALCHNSTLTKLTVDGNVLGKIGSQALVATMQRSTGEAEMLHVSFMNCDCKKEVGNLFNAAAPGGRWEVDLSEPYGQMVVEECFFLADFKAGCSITSLRYEGKVVELERLTGGRGSFNPLEFKVNSKEAARNITKGTNEAAAKSMGKLLSQFSFEMEEDLCSQIAEFIAEKWKTQKGEKSEKNADDSEGDDLEDVILFEIFHALFVISDADGSNSVDVDEFLETMEAIGRADISRDAAKMLMAEHDKGM